MRLQTLVLLTGVLCTRTASSQHVRVVRDSVPGTRVVFTLVSVPGGEVRLGTQRQRVEGFLLGQTEVTWNAYDAFMLSRTPSPRYSPAGADAVAGPSRPYGNPDYGFGHAGYPVISVTREAAEAFCAWLSGVTGHRYRLPTEAEWQRAADLATARGSKAWHAGSAAGRTHPVGALPPDVLGLHDLFGNVAEWVTTRDGSRVVRGGSWQDSATNVGAAARAVQRDSWSERDPQIPSSSWWLSDGPFVGFRVVREP